MLFVHLIFYCRFQYWISQYYFPIMMTIAWLVAVGVGISALVSDREQGLEHVSSLVILLILL